MIQIVILALCVCTPLILALLLRSNGAVLFLSFCAGSLLASLLTDDTSFIASMFLKNISSESVAKIALLTLPMIISLFVLAKSVSVSKQVLHIIPALAAGCLLTLAIIPELSNNLSSQVTSALYWPTLEKSQGAIALIGVVTSLFVIFVTVKKSKKHRKKY